MTKLPHARIAYTLGGKTDELASGFSDTDYQCWSSRNQRLRDIFEIQDNFNLEQTQTNIISKEQIKSLSVTSDPITTRLSQEMDAPPDNDHIADARTHCHVFLNCIQSRRKLVWGLGNNGQEWSMEVEQDHMVMSGRYGGQKSDSYHSCMVVL